MPNTATITSSDLTTFASGTRIRSAPMNSNFSVFRGHNIPVDPNTSASANLSWDLGSSSYRWRNVYASPVLSVTSKTTTYSASINDDVILCSTAGGAWTLTIPSTASVPAGKIYRIKKTSLDFSLLTIATTSSQTIDGVTSTTLDTQFETIWIVSDGSNWHASRYIPSIPTSYTPTGNMSTNTTYAGTWIRQGSNMLVFGKVSFSGAPNSVNFSFGIPSGTSINSTALNTASSSQALGNAGSNTAASAAHGVVLYEGSASVYIVHHGAAARWNATNPITWANGDIITLAFKVPISGWKG